MDLSLPVYPCDSADTGCHHQRTMDSMDVTGLIVLLLLLAPFLIVWCRAVFELACCSDLLQPLIFALVGLKNSGELCALSRGAFSIFRSHR